MEPFQFWRCDECGEPVTVKEGYVIWGRRDDPNGEFRIIHQRVCDDRSMTSSLPLADFLGADGLVKLTSMLSYGLLTYDTGITPRSEHRLPNIDAWVDLVRRVQVPHYEQVTLLYTQPEVRERFSDSNETYPYLQRTIATMMVAEDE